MHSKLAEILVVKKEEVAELKQKGLSTLVDRERLEKRGFEEAISKKYLRKCPGWETVHSQAPKASAAKARPPRKAPLKRSFSLN